MSHPKFMLLLIVSLLMLPVPALGYRYPRTGYQAQLTEYFHIVSGTVTILDPDSIRIDNFYYDGGGPLVYFYLGVAENNSAFENGLEIGPLLSGTAYNNDTLFIDLPPGQNLDGYHAISVWCVDVKVNFGSGTFTDPTPCDYYLDGDVNDDCLVNLVDLALSAAAWLTDCTANPLDADCIPK